MRVLRDMNLSKLIDEDEPLFISLVADLFPNQSLEKTMYSDLEDAVRKQVDVTGLIYHPPWVLKIIQVKYNWKNNLMSSAIYLMNIRLFYFYIVV